MELIERLERVAERKKVVTKLYNYMAEYEKGIGEIKAINYSDIKFQGGKLKDDTQLFNKIETMEEFRYKLNNYILELKLEQGLLFLELENKKELLGTDETLLLVCRYILNKNWEQVAKEFKLSKTHCFRLHKKAIATLKKRPRERLYNSQDKA